MRATLNIPDELISEVQELSGQKSKTKAIITALRDYIKRSKREKLLALKGKVSIDYNWEQAEGQEMTAQERREKYLEK